MLLSCPNCRTKYRISEELLDPAGSKVKCTKCGNVFTASPLDGEAEFEEKPTTPEQEAQESEERESFYVDKDLRQRAKGNGNKKRILPIALLSLLVLLFALVVFYFFVPGAEDFLPFGQSTQSSKQSEQLSRKSSSSEQEIKDIALKDVRQYMVKNEKIGNLLVIEGKALNKAKTKKEMIKIRAALFDEQGNRLNSREFFCGNTVTLFQLQVMEQKELEKALSSKVGVLTNNVDLASGEEVKFMTVFFNPSDELAEFSLKVIKAKDVKKENES